jgi:hypothetical protein
VIAERSGKRSRLNRDAKVVSGFHQAKYLGQDLTPAVRPSDGGLGQRPPKQQRLKLPGKGDQWLGIPLPSRQSLAKGGLPGSGDPPFANRSVLQRPVSCGRFCSGRIPDDLKLFSLHKRPAIGCQFFIVSSDKSDSLFRVRANYRVYCLAKKPKEFIVRRMED